MHSKDPLISSRQHNIIMGTILGGSSIVLPKNGKNCYLSMRGKEANWLEYKALELSNLSSKEPFTIEVTNRWHSSCYPVFAQYKTDFYRNNERRLKIDVLNLMKDISLAVWFGDTGKYENGHVILNTHIWGKNNNKILIKYFTNITYHADTYEENGSYRIRLDKESSQLFMELVVPHLPIWFKF